MNYAGFAVLMVLCAYRASAKVNPYCSICQDHTLCKYEGPGPACKDYGEGGISEQDKRLILDLHNWYRGRVAGGYETRGLGGPQRKGANLLRMTWDNELATMAQRWADQCLFQHDKCRQVSRFRVGQNIYWNFRTPITKVANWSMAIESWYDEVDKFNPQTVGRYKFEAATGHYTQLIWHDTHLVGCGRRNYGPNKIYVCNYGPTGNWINDPVYDIGEPCSKCPSGYSCVNGLCDGSKAAYVQTTPASINIYTRQGQTKHPFTTARPQVSKLIHNFIHPPNRNNQNNFFKFDSVKNHDFTASKYNLIDDSSDTTIEDTTIEDTTIEDTTAITTTVPTTEETESTATGLPVDFNIIDDLSLFEDDEEIKKEIEDIRMRIHKLVEKIVSKRKIHL